MKSLTDKSLLLKKNITIIDIYSTNINHKANLSPSVIFNQPTICRCCHLTFLADSRQIPILEHSHIIEVLVHANATIMFKDYRCSL